MLTVATYFWRDPSRANRGYEFEHEHVRILAGMIRRNLSIPHRFICVTTESIEGVDTCPLPLDKHIEGTVYARLIQHDPDFAREVLSVDGGKILSLDIDCCITGNLDKLIQDKEGTDYAIWKNPNWPKPQRAYFQSSVQLFEPGARPQLFHDFKPESTPTWVNWRFGGREQAWISEALSWRDTAVFTDHDGVYGAGRLGGEGIYGGDLPSNAVIVGFPGSRAPWQPDIQRKFPWLSEHYKE